METTAATPSEVRLWPYTPLKIYMIYTHTHMYNEHMVKMWEYSFSEHERQVQNSWNLRKRNILIFNSLGRQSQCATQLKSACKLHIIFTESVIIERIRMQKACITPKFTTHSEHSIVLQHPVNAGMLDARIGNKLFLWHLSFLEIDYAK